jgi:Fe-S-cluster containining protein
MLLEKLLSREKIENVLSEYKSDEEKAFEEFPILFPDDYEKEIEETKRVNILLKEKVLILLIEHSETYSDKIDEQDLSLIFDYAMATLTNLDIHSVLATNYCNRCGQCCIVTSPIVMTSDEYLHMTNIEPDLIMDIDLDLENGGFKFIEDLPCKFFDKDNKKCMIYDVRPNVCRTYPVCNRGIVASGDCAYMVKYIFERCKDILLKCINDGN